MARTQGPRARHVDAVRRFSRLYTQRIRLLDGHLPHSRLSLPEGRLLFEVAQRSPVTGAELSRALELDAGYVSRLLAALQRRGLLLRRVARSDARRREFSLSAAGRRAFAALDAGSRRQINALLDGIGRDGEARLVSAMGAIERELTGAAAGASPVVLRPHEPGDMGWVVQRHGEIYHREYGWDARFEALVARIVADFIDNLDAQRERCWIALRDGQRVGSAFLVRGDGDAAKLRLLLVDPQARGTGLGRQLVRECMRFATRAGYPRLTLWTNHVLDAARRIYAQEGFELVSSEPHESFGVKLVGEYWQRDLP